MSKKVFIIMLLAVFMLAQFSIASAATVDGEGAITSIPSFANDVDVDIDWAVTGMAGPTQNILLWGKDSLAVGYAVADCRDIATIVGTSDASGTFTYAFTAAPGNGDVWDFTATVDDALCAGASTVPAVADVMGNTTVDSENVQGLLANPPSLSAAGFGLQTVACNTFEMWALASDHYGLPSTVGYSGFGDWNAQVTGTFAPPAPIGPSEDLLSWMFTFPSTASGNWSFSINPEDAAGNIFGAPSYFRAALAIDPTELSDCANFTDVSGNENEIYIRYLAELGLISGFADGTFGPDTTLTRAEASTLFEISNGYDAATLPVAPTVACTFSDVSASDWFAGWVWQACADGFMNGIGDGRFDPNNLLTRGQIVTIFNNVDNSPAALGGFLATNNLLKSAFYGALAPFQLRVGAWTDVPIGAFYAVPVLNAYAVGIAEGTSDTTFSPDQPATRGEYVKMLYRALSRVP